MNRHSRTVRFQLLLLLAAAVLSAGCTTYYPLRSAAGDFEKGTEPWIVLGGETGAEATICWLSAKATSTRILFGPEDLPLEIVETPGLPTKTHTVTVEGLRPGETYAYAPLFTADPDSDVQLYTFTAPPDETEPFRVVIVGDMQPKAKEEVTLRGGRFLAAGVAREKPDLVVQVGDLASIGGFFAHWRLLLDNISDFSPFAPLQATAGNHDQYVDKGRNFAKLFPYNFADRKGLYYSFDFGNAHFVMLNAFEVRGKDLSDTQKAWAEADITSARQEGADWVFIIIHNTVLSTGTEGTAESLLAWLVPLADRLHVDGVFYGHDHHYEHWLVEYGKNDLVFNPSHVPEGNSINYWCTGGGGGRLEIDYGIMTREPVSLIRRMYNAVTGEPVDLVITQNPWNDEFYIDHTDDPDYGQPYGGKHYWQAPEVGTCQTDTEFFGYLYGEQTLHYILMEVDGDEVLISVRYHNGDLVSGPEGQYPQEILLTRD